ncbi:MAG: DUF2207 domain-containing protein [Candidatus Pacebacteria bacterium]|nr:DUF2207 domain-containing protein [Candidatus Paceibacterota bacterium]
MKNKSIFAVLALLLSFSFSYAETIKDYDVDIKINSDSTVDIKENILYDFESASRHGIFRNLPYSYQNEKGHFNLKYQDISVVDESGKEYTYEVSIGSDNYEIKIGDPDVLVTGEKDYVIKYKVERAMNYFEDHDELYWNAIGTDWEVPIKNASISVEGKDINQHDCYYGYAESKNNCTFSEQDGRLIANIDELTPSQGVTIALGMPKGIIYEPTKEERMMQFIEDNWYFPIPFLIFIFFFFRWYRYGRDPKGKNVIIPQYSPLDGISPLESKTITTESVDLTNIGAEIIQLAIKGYLKIEKVTEKVLLFDNDGYKFIKLKESDDGLTKYQSGMIKALFDQGRNEITTFEIKKMAQEIGNSYSTNLRGFLTSEGPNIIYDRLTKEGYFPNNPSDVKVVNGLISACMFLPMFIIPMILGFAIPGLIGLFLFFGVLTFSLLMPKKTIKGVEAKEYLEGLKKYISVAEIERIKFHNAPEKSPEHFEELLPYAIIFGLEKEWAKKFESLTYQPNWYVGQSGMAFNSAVIASDISNIGNSVSTTMASSGASGLGGAGGVGGGGGGGGGGSW